jgi:CHAD domain-containing protein
MKARNVRQNLSEAYRSTSRSSCGSINRLVPDSTNGVVTVGSISFEEIGSVAGNEGVETNMTFRFQQNEGATDALRRIALEEVESAVADIDDEDLDLHETVHEVRKRCKKIRGLLRLLRPAFEDTYQLENSYFRDAARALSEVRDATTRIESLDALIRRFPHEASNGKMSPLRAVLLERRKQAASYLGIEERLQHFRTSMREAKNRIGDWTLDGDVVVSLGMGFQKTYRRTRKAMKAARTEPTTEAFHEWRKRVKYHRYHITLLKDACPAILAGRRVAVKELSDFIGDDHDLAVLGQTVLAEPHRFGGEETLETFRELQEARRRELQVWALHVGRRLFTDKPKDWKRRVEKWWSTWKEEQELVYALGAPSRRVYS